jgi:hypothetical protein
MLYRKAEALLSLKASELLCCPMHPQCCPDADGEGSGRHYLCPSSIEAAS